MWLLGLIDPISKITQAIIQARIAAANAVTDRERIDAEERAKALEARRDVLVAEAPSKINALIRALLTIPVIVLLWKIYIFDKVLGAWLHWRTDPLDENLWRVVMIQIGFYFLYEAARTLRR